MERWRLTPGQWQALARAERVDLLAWQYLRDERRERLRREVQDKAQGESGVLAQLLVLLDER